MENPPSLDLALMIFEHVEGAERAYSQVRDRATNEPWLKEVAFVEHHGHDRLLVRGTVAEHYLDVDDHGDAMGKRVAEGAVTGGAVGLLLGPVGLAAGMAAGGVAGGVSQSDSAPLHHNVLLDDFRLEIPEGSSALALLAAPAHVDEMVGALEGQHGQLIRHHLNQEQAAALLAAVADAPAAAE